MARAILGLASIALAAFLMTAGTSLAADEAGTVEGTITAVSEDQITVTDAEGNAKMAKVAANCAVTLDGEEAEVTDLKAGMKATLTMGPDKSVTRIAATSAAP